ncbi:MAG: hypothetical protein Ct9H300mP4_06280 [Gammaproteobacteria bacterium]|nr:MAG: hypothetical protein Ct9H300mP4_06280 [Gammaproteobacteria bacterium]
MAPVKLVVFFYAWFAWSNYSGRSNWSTDKTLGEKKLVQLGALSAMTGLILIGSATFEFSLWIGLFFFGCGAATFNPSLSSLISKSADPSSEDSI